MHAPASVALGQVFLEGGIGEESGRIGVRVDFRATIAFRVEKAQGVIIRVFHGGQDFERKLRGEGV